MAHTAKPGLHLEQDAASGMWQIASHAPKLTRLQKLWAKTAYLRSNKWIVASAAGAAGVSLALLASNITTFSHSSNNPVVLFKAAPQPTTSIALAAVDYGQPGASDSSALPPPVQNPGPLPQLPFQTDLAPLAANEPQPAGNNAASSRQTAQPRAIPADVPMAVFNEPLQPKTIATPQVSAPVQPGANQQPQSRLGPVVLSASSVTQSKPVPNSKSVGVTSTAPNESAGAQSSGLTGESRAHILAVPNAEAIVITNPATRLPMMVKLGERLPDGSTLKSVDKNSSSAVTSHGETLSLR